MNLSKKTTLSILASLGLFATSCGSDGTEASEDETTTTEAADDTAEAEASEEAEEPAAEGEAEETTTTEADASDEEEADAADAEDEASEEADDGATDPAAAPSISITAVSFSANTITISNDGDTPVDLDGYYLCNRPAYAPLSAAVLEPGATMELDGSVIDIQGDGGEVGLYASERFDSALDLVAYVQWGNGDNGRASVAVAGGLIADGEFVENGGEDFTNG